jgi:hypothetical protein
MPVSQHLEYDSANLGPPGSDDSSKRAFFIELWDVTGAPQYHAARSIFYQRINGVIGVHDLTNRRTRSNLHRWASEVASLGSFSAPSPESPFEGGLPVPFLTVGNKSDSKRWDSQGGGKMPLPSSPLKRVATRLGSMAEQLEARLGAFSDDESAAPLTKKATKWAAKLGEYVNGGPNGHELPRSDSISSWSGLLTVSDVILLRVPSQFSLITACSVIRQAADGRVRWICCRCRRCLFWTKSDVCSAECKFRIFKCLFVSI